MDPFLYQWSGNTNGKMVYLFTHTNTRFFFLKHDRTFYEAGPQASDWGPDEEERSCLIFKEMGCLLSIKTRKTHIIENNALSASSVSAGHFWLSSFCTLFFKCIVIIYAKFTVMSRRWQICHRARVFHWKESYYLKTVKTGRYHLHMGFVYISANHGSERILELFLQLGFFFFLFAVHDALILTPSFLHV